MLPLLFLLVSTSTTASSTLQDFHRSFVNYSTTIDAALVDFRSSNNALGFQLTHAALQSFAGFILEMRHLAYDTWQIVEEHEGDSSESCRNFIREIFELFVEIAENDMKTCAARWVRMFEGDVAERFWPAANGAQRFSGNGLGQVLGTLGEMDGILDTGYWSEVERQLEVDLGRVGAEWVVRRKELEDEVDRHEQFSESIKQSFEACEEEALGWHELYMDYVIGMFYDYCLWEEE